MFNPCQQARHQDFCKMMAIVKKTVSQLLDIFKVRSRTQLVAQVYRAEIS
ncbi:hypothetical protein FM102_06355 [Corynebacterium glutamicum]|nr:hypothetical protein FM102_06355 [Corynebacterium glutamicum]